MLRIIYVWLIRLHPPYFRNRFADEMLSIFDQETGLLAALRAVADGAWSLLRQRTVRHEFWREPELKVASESVPSFRALDDAELTKGAWFKGIALSVSVFCVFWLAIVFGQNEIPQGRPAIVQDYGLAVLSLRFDPNNFQSGLPADSTQSENKPHALLPSLFAGALTSTRQDQGTPANQPHVPQWQSDAGGKMAFDITSVKQDTAEPSQVTVHSNVPLGPLDSFAPVGGLLSAANFPLFQYIAFAYKLTPEQLQAVQAQLPKWVNTDRYDIQARASGNPTKDQFRLMMQALLADRFRLVAHYQTRQLPVLALVLDKPEKLGPLLRPHSEESPCTAASLPLGSSPGPATTVAGGFPEICGSIQGMQPSAPGRFRAGARNVPLALLITLINNPQFTGMDRPVVDRTGLAGKFDFVIELTPQFNGPPPPDSTSQPNESGPTFFEALKQQLGLKAEPQMGSVDVVVIDHVEEPSSN